MNSPQKSEPQRKQVTVLFADVKGYTAMSETMDAEDVTEIMNALWQRLDGIIVAQNGMIDKHIGDAIMAVWGTAVTREEDRWKCKRNYKHSPKSSRRPCPCVYVLASIQGQPC